MKETKERFEELVQIVAKLRTPGEGCPWDLEQTPRTLYPMMIDETYEAVEAIEKEDWKNLKEELGDLFLHLVLQTQIATEEKRFTVAQVLEEINEKLIRRHPHVFGEVKIKDTQEVLEQWDEIKKKEGKKKKKDFLPPGLPALIGLLHVVEKKKSLQIPPEQILQNLQNNLEECRPEKEFAGKKKALSEMFLGLVQLTSQMKIHPEELLREKVQEIQQTEESAEKKGD